MRCPYCGNDRDRVVDSRGIEDGAAIRRRRACGQCGQRYTTYERIEEVPILVRKRSGEHEPFSLDKLRAGIERAATGRIDDATLDALVADLDAVVRAHGSEVASDVVGVEVLERLRTLDAVAYMRYASVYKGFEDLADFEREVGELARMGRGERLEKSTAPKLPSP